MEPETTTTFAPERRSCMGCLFTTTLGCGAFLSGSVLAAALFAPSLLGGLAARLLEDQLSKDIGGEVRIEGLELSWNGTQRATGVKLFDPDGEDVLVMNLRLPSLFELLDTEDRRRLDFEVIVERAEIIVGEDGVSNFQRAIWRGGAPPPRGGGVRVGRVSTRDGFDEGTAYRIDVRRAALSWTDRRDPSAAYEVRDLKLLLLCDARGEITADGSATVVTGAGRGVVEVNDVVLSPPERGVRPVRGTVDATGLSGDWLDRMLGADGHLAALLGESVDAHAEVAEPAAGESVSAVTASVVSTAAELDFDGELAGGVLRLSSDGRLDVDLDVSPSLFDELTRAALPDGFRLEREGTTRWTLEARSFETPVQRSGEPAFEGLLSGLNAVFRLQIDDDFRVIDAGGGERLAWRIGETTLGATAGAGFQLDARVGVSGADEETTLVLRTAEDLDSLIFADGQEARPFELDLHSGALPTSILDELVARDGFLGDLFGDRVELHFAVAELRDTGGPAIVRVTSLVADSYGTAMLEGGFLQSTAGSTIDLDLDLTRPGGAGAVASIMPWLVVSEADGARMVLESFRIPLDGGVADLDAKVRVELGRSEYRYDTRFYERLCATTEQALVTETFLPVTATVERGVASFDELILYLGGEECIFTGTFDLASEALDIDGEVPLLLMVGQLGLNPALTGQMKESNVLVEMNVVGPWHEPETRFDTQAFREFLQGGLSEMVQDAAPALKELFDKAIGDG